MGGIIGPALPTFELTLGSSIPELSTSFTAASIGSLCGTFICGAIYERINKELLFSVASLVYGIMMLILPHMGHLYSFITVMTIGGVFSALFETGGTWIYTDS